MADLHSINPSPRPDPSVPAQHDHDPRLAWSFARIARAATVRALAKVRHPAARVHLNEALARLAVAEALTSPPGARASASASRELA